MQRLTPQPSHLLSYFLRAACGGALAFCAFSAAAQWTQEGHNAGRSYANNEETTLSRENVAGLSVQWQRQLGQFYASEVTQSGQAVLACSNLYGTSSLFPATGSSQWNRHVGVSDCQTPASAGTRTYLASSNLAPENRNVISAVDTVNGNLLWEKDLPGGSDNLGLEAPVTDGTRVYMSSHRGQIIAVKAADGSSAWRVATDPGVYNNAPAVLDGRVFVSAREPYSSPTRSTLRALDAATGAPLWSAEVGTSNIDFPAMAFGKVVVVQDNAGVVKAYNTTSGKALWSHAMGGYIGQPIAGAAGMVYAARGTQVTALDAKTGQVVWTRTLPKKNTAMSNPVWANGLLFVAGKNPLDQEAVLVLNARNGKPVSTTPVTLHGSYARLSVADGRVYISTSGYLSALGL